MCIALFSRAIDNFTNPMRFLQHLAAILLSLTITAASAAYVYGYSAAFAIKPQAQERRANLLPDAPFAIVFSAPVNSTYYADNIQIEPRIPMTATINAANDKIVITPTTSWQPNTRYTITLPAARTLRFAPVAPASFEFTIVPAPTIASITPADGTTDVRLDIEDPIIVSFDRSTDGFDVDFRMMPETEIKYQNNEAQTDFEILSQKPLTEDTTYTLDVHIKPRSAANDAFVSLASSSFTTLPPQPKTWAENRSERIEQAKRFTLPRITTGKYIDINLATQIMTTFNDGNIHGAYLISSGKRGMDTPKGTHQIYNKSPRPWSKQYHLFMPYWMAITSDGKYGIHELPEWPGGYKEGQNHLGIPVSHGCVRLGVGPAETVYHWADIGTPVVVY